jgi:ring-1,2-phenylacetyl-CoA epoxidase subunit PaaD
MRGGEGVMSAAVTDIPLQSGQAREISVILESVTDPEIPVLTIAELGVLRGVAVEDGTVTVTITPTYSGCPAMTVIEMDIRDALLRAGYTDIRVKTVLAPAWTTDWLAESGREKLRALGIAPPVGKAAGKAAGKGALLGIDPEVSCPRCGSSHTHPLSRFGSAACKALYRCEACQEPFDYFKCI